MSEEPEVTQTYESATARLDEIIQRLDSGEAQLRETLDLCEEAKGLIEYCAGELAAVDHGLKELKLEELAGSLTGPSAPAAEEPAAGTSESTPGSDSALRPAPDDPTAPAESDIPF